MWAIFLLSAMTVAVVALVILYIGEQSIYCNGERQRKKGAGCTDKAWLG